MEAGRARGHEMHFYNIQQCYMSLDTNTPEVRYRGGKVLDDLDAIYVNRGPGSYAGIRNSLATIKALFLVKKIDYYCYSFDDFKGLNVDKYEDVPYYCKKFKIKKNLINPIYLS